MLFLNLSQDLLIVETWWWCNALFLFSSVFTHMVVCALFCLKKNNNKNLQLCSPEFSLQLCSPEVLFLPFYGHVKENNYNCFLSVKYVKIYHYIIQFYCIIC